MTSEKFETSFRDKVSTRIRVESEGLNRVHVFTPFTFEDGDHLVILLKRDNGSWYLSDEGHTFMHLAYELDEKSLLRPTRQKIIRNTLSMFQVEDRDGELIMNISEKDHGDALYSYIQALLKLSDLTFLSRERAISTFLEDFRNLIETELEPDRFQFNWNSAEHDPHAMYTVDCRINKLERPLFLFAIRGNDRAQYSTIALLQYEKLEIPNRSIAIFEDQETIDRKVLARLSDVCEKQFSTLVSNEKRIRTYLRERVQE